MHSAQRRFCVPRQYRRTCAVTKCFAPRTAFTVSLAYILVCSAGSPMRQSRQSSPARMFQVGASELIPSSTRFALVRPDFFSAMGTAPPQGRATTRKEPEDGESHSAAESGLALRSPYK